MDNSVQGRTLWKIVEDAYLEGFKAFQARRRKKFGYYTREEGDRLLIFHKDEHHQHIASLEYKPERRAVLFEYEYRGFNRRRSIVFRRRNELLLLPKERLEQFVAWAIRHLDRPVLNPEITFDPTTERSGLRWISST